MTARVPQTNVPQASTPARNNGTLQRLTGSLRGRLILALAAAAIVPTAISGFWGSNLTQERNRQINLELLEITALQTSALADEFLDDARVYSRLINESGLFVDALRASNQRVEAEGLAALPPEVLDKRYEKTKVLQPLPELNKFLRAIVASSTVSDILVTESHGINIALSGSASDVVQSDEDWWQRTRAVGKPLTLEPEFDESSEVFAIELTDVIRDPSNDVLLGVVEIGFPADSLKASLEILLAEQELIKGGTRVENLQLLNAYTALGKPFITLGNGVGEDRQGENQLVIGGDRIKNAAVYLRRVQSIAAITPEEASEELANNYGLTPLLVERLEVAGAQTVLAIFEDDDRIYSVAAVRGAPWTAITSTQKASIAAAGRELNQVFLLTGAILAVVAAAVALLLARQLSQPLTQLSAAAQKVAAGDLSVRAAATGTAETQTLAGSFNNLVARVQGLLNTQQQKAERDRLFGNIALVAQPDELEAPLNAVMARLREDLRLNPHG
ncbi:MAG: HAMP domain-containing protein, partial [Cyanobacteria bacterium J06641_5]